MAARWREAVALLDRSNRRTEGTLGERREVLDSLVNMLDSKSSDLDQRLTRVLRPARPVARRRQRTGARDRAPDRRFDHRRHARRSPSNSNRSATTPRTEHQRTAETMRSIYEQSTGDAHDMFAQAADRFAEVVDGLKHMAADMQRELDATRTELRKGILELPQETAESAAQMRRVIVDQIEALAELNRIVARHGRGFDTVDPTRRAAPKRPPRSAAARRPGPRQRCWRTAARDPPPPPAAAPARDITGISPPADPDASGGIALAQPRRTGRPRRTAAGSPTCSAAPRRTASRRASRRRVNAQLPRDPDPTALERPIGPRRRSAAASLHRVARTRSRSTSPA